MDPPSRIPRDCGEEPVILISRQHDANLIATRLQTRVQALPHLLPADPKREQQAPMEDSGFGHLSLPCLPAAERDLAATHSVELTEGPASPASSHADHPPEGPGFLRHELAPGR